MVLELRRISALVLSSFCLNALEFLREEDSHFCCKEIFQRREWHLLCFPGLFVVSFWSQLKPILKQLSNGQSTPDAVCDGIYRKARSLLDQIVAIPLAPVPSATFAAITPPSARNESSILGSPPRIMPIPAPLTPEFRLTLVRLALRRLEMAWVQYDGKLISALDSHAELRLKLVLLHTDLDLLESGAQTNSRILALVRGNISFVNLYLLHPCGSFFVF